MPPRLSEAALARRFAKRHRKQLRYVAKWGHWYWWTGTVWQEDTTEEVLDEARLISAGDGRGMRQGQRRRAASPR